MKELIIQVRINEHDDKVATLIQKNGFEIKSIEDNFQILGILQNLCFIQNEKLKELQRIKL